MTGEDHNTDALIAALRSPALPAEQVGEAAAVTAILEALGRVPAPSVLRVRRGIAIAVVTVASLGVGGLAAAGPGVFTSAANRARALVTSESGEHDGGVPGDDSDRDSSSGDPDAPGGVPGALLNGVGGQPGALAENGAGDGSTSVECADGNHGATVTSDAQGELSPDAANRGAVVSVAAQSDCGQINNAGGLDNGADNGNGPPTSLPNANGADNGNGPPTSLPNANGADNGNGPPTSLPNGTGADNGAGRSGVTPPTPTAPPGIGNAENGADNGLGQGNGLGDASGVGTGNVSDQGIVAGQNKIIVPDDASTDGSGNGNAQNG